MQMRKVISGEVLPPSGPAAMNTLTRQNSTDRVQELRSSTPRTRLFRQKSAPPLADMKAKQSSKIRELADALEAAGIHSLDERARVLGLPRSTTWSILKGDHKSSGLSASVINRMLSAPHLPTHVRDKILEYVAEKAAGLYGNSRVRLREFNGRLSRWSQSIERAQNTYGDGMLSRR
jgi:hypothetical protein